MNFMRKYAVWIVAIGLAAFILPSAIEGVMDVFTGDNSGKDSSVQIQNQPYEPPFRHDGNLYAINNSDTTAVFRTEYAKSANAIEMGMMYRKNVDADMAMLFFMPDGDQLRSFWMKNTYISLDIIYINAAGSVVDIAANAEPLSTRSLPSSAPAAYVLEVLGGTAAEKGITVGTTIAWSNID